ncbi:unnamed protein product [Protopolystoma xenopodis]|uniref:Uncharacterized protein n=1 Tax=Protopolystoma xenopodis TaxID=117903 RepID=A0A448XCB6_9PLAT|nr:unnamed protein product [Protopolystoma xenopodis]
MAECHAAKQARQYAGGSGEGTTSVYALQEIQASVRASEPTTGYLRKLVTSGKQVLRSPQMHESGVAQ